MLTEQACLALQLIGPMQAWGFESQYNRRNTGLFPTKSALAGMICAAFGASRGSERETEILEAIRTARLLVVAVPRVLQFKGRDSEWQRSLAPRRITDYHTVQGTLKATGKPKDTHLTHRQYLNDAGFAAVLSGAKSFLQHAAKELDDPRWGIWLGRKACIPAAPVLVRHSENPEDLLFANEADALSRLLAGRPLAEFSHQREVSDFEQGGDSLPDQPVSFESDSRKFTIRRISRKEPGQSETKADR